MGHDPGASVTPGTSREFNGVVLTLEPRKPGHGADTPLQALGEVPSRRERVKQGRRQKGTGVSGGPETSVCPCLHW